MNWTRAEWDVLNSGEILQSVCHGASLKAGWWSGEDLTEVNKGTRLGKLIACQKLLLSIGELSEATEGLRKGKMDERLPHRTNFEVELADAVIRIADLAGAMGLDLGSAIVDKMAYNAKREDHKPDNRAAAGGKAF